MEIAHIFNSPLSVPISGRKRFILNLNPFQRAHYQTLSKAKNNYIATMAYQIQASKKFGACTIEYVTYPGNNASFDLGNVVSIHKKFFEDALVFFKKLDDDNYHIIQGSSERFGAVDKKFPRVEIIVTEIKKGK